MRKKTDLIKGLVINLKQAKNTLNIRITQPLFTDFPGSQSKFPDTASSTVKIVFRAMFNVKSFNVLLTCFSRIS